MRIGLLLDQMALHPGGALHNYVSHLVRLWSREHEIWWIDSRPRWPAPAVGGTIRVCWWQPWRRQVRERVDVVHRPLYSRVPEYFYSLQRPRVVTLHGARNFILNQMGLAPPPGRDQLRLRERQQEVDLFLTVSCVAQREIEEFYGIPGERIVPIHPGMDQESFFLPVEKEAARRRAAERFGIPGPYLLHVSNYWPSKNGPRIVAAYRRLWEQGIRDFVLVIAGRAKFGFEEVEKEIRRAPGTIVRLGRRVHGRELTELYQGAEVYLSPSLHESFGMPALEAMACGVPAVVSNRYAHPEVTGGAAVEVNPENIEDIARAAARLLRDPAFYADRRRAGLARAAECRWDICAQKHLEAFGRAQALFTQGWNKRK